VREAENKEKIPMYKRILGFLRGLQQDGSIEVDRMAYTKKLFENANVFGITCTSRENFKAEKMGEQFTKYALDDLDVKKQGIDVVIIDEVSKSSFLDLLIPILYGKTVILVGDHRQLPPMYDLRNLRNDDFDGLDPNVITKRKNDEYTNLYEECFFKTLFENVPDRLRVTLTKQYRCHGDIMKVFNHFYTNGSGRGSLELGLANQNDQKQHGLLIKGKNGRTLIDRDKHIYFVDCGESYEKFGDSTSATNETEARVIVELAKRIDEAYGRTERPQIDEPRRIDKRPSMGVICTYGDQAKLIKRKLNKNALRNINELFDERFIVSTVDDFQGDERDIIFVSMVRNPVPVNRAKTRAEFVKKFERINVALSRARRLLVIVGSKDFLSEATIDLPDMSGNRALDRQAVPIYKDIIGTIAVHGLVLKASEVLVEDK
jgi:superfamily I DNA and/or RNA helicase